MTRARLNGLTMLMGIAFTLGSCGAGAPTSAEVTDVEQVSATVAAVDPAARLITLRDDTFATELTFAVDESVRNLPQVEVGDRVTLDYYSGIAAELTDANPADEMGVVDVGSGRAAPGERPAGLEGARVSAVVEIEDVDTRRNIVAFRGADGLVRIVEVKRPKMQQFIRGLKAGDKVRVSYFEAVAVNVAPAS